MNKEKYVKVCPKCGSTNVSSFSGKYFSSKEFYLRCECKDCGYEGVIPEVEQSKLKKFKDRIKCQA